MPFLTRDFALFLLTVAFLVVGITATVHQDLVSKNNFASVATSVEGSPDVVYEAVLPQSENDARPSRLASLREKIAALVLAPVPEEEVEEVVVAVEEEAATVPGAVSLCSNYAPQFISWQPQGLKFEVVEGARIIYREGEPVSTVNELGETVLGLPVRTILAQLPLRSFPSPTKNCLSSDIIGIALDGSLIRNAEYPLYTIFGEETLLGYALDGFPIYGATSRKTDSCGGSAASGAYRYYLSADRAGVVGCFSGEAIAL